VNSQLPSQKEAIKILRESGCSPPVIRHCKAVARLSVQIAKKCVDNGVNINVELVHIGGLLHDVGRSRTHSVHHPIVGAEIARSLGLPECIVSIIRCHLGGGITPEEAREFGWPEETYMPETLEEKIVTYADKLIEGDRIVPVEKAIQKLKKRLGENHESPKRVMLLHEEISNLCLKQRK
jgi:uncharacterized protein